MRLDLNQMHDYSARLPRRAGALRSRLFLTARNCIIAETVCPALLWHIERQRADSPFRHSDGPPGEDLEAINCHSSAWPLTRKLCLRIVPLIRIPSSGGPSECQKLPNSRGIAWRSKRMTQKRRE